ncbi:phosphopantetheine-binding protein [Sulfitobacter sp. HNIBRBA2951]|uniref:phosphopantetheine-binding protein n=1 Tax=Sulfitobacter aquimarinus TaxID=3158557 RepID=UPI0032DFB895
MPEWSVFCEILSRYTKVDVARDSVLFGDGLNLSSIRFAEFILDLEETCDLDIDIDELDASIKTAGQLYDQLRVTGAA